MRAGWLCTGEIRLLQNGYSDVRIFGGNSIFFLSGTSLFGSLIPDLIKLLPELKHSFLGSFFYHCGMAGIDSRDFGFEPLFNQKTMYPGCGALVMRNFLARQNIMPREGHCSFRREAKPLRALRRGFEGFGLPAEPRPAGCRRIPLSVSPPNSGGSHD